MVQLQNLCQECQRFWVVIRSKKFCFFFRQNRLFISGCISSTDMFVCIMFCDFTVTKREYLRNGLKRASERRSVVHEPQQNAGKERILFFYTLWRRALKCHALSVTVTHFGLLSCSHCISYAEKLFIIYWICRSAPNVSGRAALTMEPTGIKRVSPAVLTSRACHLSANQKKEKVYTLAN